MAKGPSTLAAAPLSDADINILKSAVVATKDNTFIFVKPDASAILVAGGYAETNPAMEDADGIATRATQKGIDYIMAILSVAASIATLTPTPKFEIDSGIPLPVIRRNHKSGGSKSAYPFEQLEVGQSFHVAADDVGKIPRIMAAAVSNANKHYATKTGETDTVKMPIYEVDAKGKRVKVNGHFNKTGEKDVTRPKLKHEREFVLRSVDATDARGAGVRVFRTV